MIPDHLTPAEVKRDAPLAPWTSVRVGGAAEALVKPASADSLQKVLQFAHKEGLALSLLGGGANTLVGDLGVPGITLKLANDYFPEQIEGERITLNAGSAIARIVTIMKQQQLVGAEFLAGIPGTLGGATAMNAGTKNGECMTIVEAVELVTPDGIGWVTGLTFRYRHTDLPAGAVVSRVRFQLRQGDLAESAAKMEADLGYRKRTQPLSQPNFGSVFTNPSGYFAGSLIEKTGLKGHRIGNAQISTLHANWIVNLGGATAADVTGLMAEAQRRVLAETGVTLTPEVKRLGRFTS
ncbi:MAG: UDP-N-acetylmuramate dehydrogenase [Archangium sp.]|nr:UDP-N-acetylmuramate dehydrogenase [Archangium sp.]MDP3570354.1 UDP-N-acetylmuramate dehydrogenase [Archangium sp.]